MIPLLEQAAEVEGFVRANKWKSCIIGGLAVMRWGEPRFTRDIDISLFTGFGHEEEFAQAVLARYAPRITDALAFAIENRVLLVAGDGGIPIDIALSGFRFEEDLIDRATPFEFVAGLTLTTASAEDLVVLKAFADRDRDWADIAGIVTRQPSLEWAAILERLTPLVQLKEAPGILDRLHAMRGGA